MRVLVVGAGPVGAYVAAQLGGAGAAVTLHGRGRAFERMRELQAIERMTARGHDRTAVACAESPPPEHGWDLLVLAVKAHDLGTAATAFQRHARGAVVLLPQNGIPWWQFLGTAAPPLRLDSVDPGRKAEQALPLAGIAGCVVTKGLSFDADLRLVEAVTPADQVAVGDVVQGSGASERIRPLLQASALPLRLSDDIRADKWRKLFVNVAFNALGAISHQGFGEVLDEPAGERLARTLADEALAVARRMGFTAGVDLEAAFRRARGSRTHKTSMLQDVEAGRRPEIDPIFGAVLELGHGAGIATPATEAVDACMRLIASGLGKGPIRRVARTT